MTRIGGRRLRLFGVLLGTVALAGCEIPGESGLDAELARIEGVTGFAVISSDAGRAVFAARGHRIVVEPPDGYCLDEGSVDVSRLAAFALVADCLQDQLAALERRSGAGQVSEIALPRSFPGILTISISGEPAFDQKPQALDDFEAFIETGPGRKLIGRGNGGESGKVVATRRVGGALYVLIEGPSAAGNGFLAPRFWRAFIDINDRLTLVTVSSFSDRPIAEDAMMGFLAQQIARLRDVNGLPADGEEREIAGQMIETLDLASGTDTLIVGRTGSQAETSDGISPARAPLPPARRLASAQVVSTQVVRAAGQSAWAPSSAPIARRRPG